MRSLPVAAFHHIDYLPQFFYRYLLIIHKGRHYGTVTVVEVVLYQSGQTVSAQFAAFYNGSVDVCSFALPYMLHKTLVAKYPHRSGNGIEMRFRIRICGKQFPDGLRTTTP